MFLLEMEVTKNIFTGGLNMDISKLVEQNSTITDGKNIRIISLGSDTYAITNIEGTSEKFSLTSGFIPIGNASYNGVCYIISYNSTTLQGEIGSFPSPNYIDGNLENTYKPFRNYNGDISLGVGVYGDFRSTEFNFDLFHEITDIAIQNEYDGTVNIIFTDNKNPVRIINSRFTILPDNKYEIINREGKDTNLYVKDSFKNTINLIVKSDKILNITFNGVVQGGKVRIGNYIFYFKYATQDLNATEVIGQSFTCSVFYGDKVSNTKGGKDSEETNKQIKLTLSNLDQAYKYVKVFFVRSGGDDDIVETAYAIDANYSIVGDTMEFSYTGFENVTIIEKDSLSVTFSNIDTARTLTQIQGYLLLGNIKEKKYDKSPLEEFAKRITLGFKEHKLNIVGLNDVNDFYNATIDQVTSINDGWNAAYYNPKNIYEKLGYWGGEAYAFGIVYVFPDGTLSPVFPCIGIDNVNNSFGIINYNDAQIDQIIADRFNNTTGENSLGIYRFPNRNAINVADIVINADNTITINGVTFRLPSGTVYNDIKTATIGCFFVRANRIADVIGQGYLVPTVKAQAFADYQYDHGRTEWNTELESTYKVLPLIGAMIETVRKHPGSGSDTVTNFLFRFQRTMLSGRNPVDQKRYGFYSNDAILTPNDAVTNYNNRDIAIKRLGTVTGVGDVPYINSLNRTSLTLFRTSGISKGFIGDNINAKSYWTLANFEGRNAGLFSSLESHLEGRRGADKYLLWAAWNSYIGIVLKDLTTIDDLGILTAIEGSETQSGVVLNESSDYINASQTLGFLANIYSDGGQKTTAQIGNTHNNIDSFQYYPISKRLYWSEIEAQMDVDRRITCFNGDCFIGLGHRTQYINKELDQSAIGPYDDSKITNVVTILNESNNNIALRGEEPVSSTDLSSRSFLPYLENSSQDYSVVRERKYRYLESEVYLDGHSKIKGDRQYVVIPQGVPYIANNWFTRIYASEKHIPNSFENGYRKFLGLTFEDYDTAYGPIVKITSVNGALICVQEHGVCLIPVNERIQTGTDTGGRPIFLENVSILSKYTTKISEKFGSKYQSSIITTDNTVYGIDTSAKKIWRIEQGGLKFISDFAVGSFLFNKLSYFDNKRVEVGTIGICVTQDKRFDEVLFTCYDIASPTNTFTVCFNEAINKFTCFYDFTPASYGILNDTIISFNNGKYHEHNINSLRSNFYGNNKEAIIEFVVNKNKDIIKVFDFLHIISNDVSPSKIEFFTENQEGEVISGIDVGFEDEIIKYKEKKFVVQVPESLIVGGVLDWDDDARFRDKYLKVRITYDTNSKIELSNVNTFFRYSKS